MNTSEAFQLLSGKPPETVQSQTFGFGLGLGSGIRPKLEPKTQRDPDSEFSSVHFGIEIKKKEKNFF